MTAWLPMIVKGLGHIATISTMLPPALTRRSTGTADNQLELAQKQIAELQIAASQTDTNLRELAAQLKDVLTAIEQGAASVERRLHWLYGISIAATALATLAAIVALFR